MDNELFKKLYNLYCDNLLSHVFLIETNNINKTNEEIYNLIKTIENIDNNISNDSLYGTIVINPTGKNIKKESIDLLKNSFAKKAVFSKNSYYIINEAEKMNDVAFNRLLKFMEEPEDNILGFLLTENKDFLPDTIVSRCQILKVNYELEEKQYKYLNIISEYRNIFKTKSLDIIWYNESVICKSITERVEFINFFKEMLDSVLIDIKNNVERDINLKVVSLLNKYLLNLNYNVNTSLLLNSFALEMVDIYGK